LEELSKKEQKRIRKEAHKKKVEERKKEAGIVRKIVLAAMVILLVAIAVIGFSAYRYIAGALGPVDENSDEIKEVEIPIGSTTSSIAHTLEDEGVIDNASLFRYYVRFQDVEGFQAGNYALSPSMSADDIIEELQEGTLYEEYAASITIPEGFWTEQIFERVENETDISAQELQEFSREEEYLETLIDEYDILTEAVLAEEIKQPLEGYLFPARYDFTEDELDPRTIIETMVKRMDEELKQTVPDAVDETHELLSKASIIEGEARGDEERRGISGVIENRLRVPMRLQMDPTVSYAHGERFARTLTAYTEIESPYNTYHTEGLPAGPINNPGIESIRAAADPESHDYLYFYHSPEGEIYFNETLEQHNSTVNQYRD
jgi:UPF0755 protein